MKIQVISHNGSIKFGSEHHYTYSALGEPKTFDSFDINIITLQSRNLWDFKSVAPEHLDSYDDIKTLHALVQNAHKSTIIICIPQNYTCNYSYNSNRYSKSNELKNMLSTVRINIESLLPGGSHVHLLFENAETSCGSSKFTSSFSFLQVRPDSILTACNGGENATTYKVTDNIILTSLDLSNTAVQINDFLTKIGLLKITNEIPEWLSEYSFYDDQTQKQTITIAKAEIEKQNVKISEAESRIKDNLKYKRILVESGDELVNIVYDIFGKMLKYDLSTFVDEKREDFLLKYTDVTFVGEIKGITSNVKSENVSQLDVHCQSYADKLEDESKEENIKGLLIINPLRSKPLSERDEVHEKQIELAKRNGSLIITSDILLFLFEKYLRDETTTEKVIELFRNKTGLLSRADCEE